ncbi:hypothetical protein BO85DRAFT_110478 [Aspergillus piperis CBS 112811]|uniref:Uncharacterized protein n=1 Tax=Aspergillus piperis CBS 112811 TaxID=1448313 RepID=A0A8G1R8Q0_9EURO|nr:hypothetical protein BO85DRAFT_110478 [Aspergillus piperis CBS 112811]RAH61603.1 hypothetical protein BO85DRAFT_110478 [Aspergillus piperis CBS 112811]
MERCQSRHPPDDFSLTVTGTLCLSLPRIRTLRGCRRRRDTMTQGKNHATPLFRLRGNSKPSQTAAEPMASWRETRDPKPGERGAKRSSHGTVRIVSIGRTDNQGQCRLSYSTTGRRGDWFLRNRRALVVIGASKLLASNLPPVGGKAVTLSKKNEE